MAASTSMFQRLWNVLRVVLELTAGVVGFGVAGQVASEIRFSVGGDAGAVLAFVLEPVACVAALWGLHRFTTGLTLRSIGARFEWSLAPFLLGSAMGIAVFGVGLLIASVHPDVSIESDFGGFSDGLAAVVKAWEAGVWEEALFRGFVLVLLLRRGLGLHPAAALSVLLFALMHAGAEPWYWAFWTILPGYAFTYLYYRTGSLWAPVGCHAAFNAGARLSNAETLFTIQGTDDHLGVLAVAWGAVFLALAVALAADHGRLRRAGRTSFPLPRFV